MVKGLPFNPLLGAALFLGLPVLAQEPGEILVSWVHPTTYTDGSPLEVSDIVRTLIEWGTCGPNNEIVEKAGEFNENSQATSTSIPISAVGSGPRCWRYRTITLDEAIYETLELRLAAGKPAVPNAPTNVTVTESP